MSIVCMNHDLFLQWAENFICDEVAGEELWEEVVAAARMLANSTEAEVEECTKPENLRELPFLQKVDDCWENFPVAHWRRRRVRLQGENFHCIPHPGEVPDIQNFPEN